MYVDSRHRCIFQQDGIRNSQFVWSTMFGNCFSPNMLLVARVLGEGDSDSLPRLCYASLYLRLPTLCVFKLLCVGRRGADAYPCDKPVVEGGSCTPLLSWCVSCVSCGSRWILTVLSLVQLRARLSHCFTPSLLDFVLRCTWAAHSPEWLLHACETWHEYPEGFGSPLVMQ